MFPDSHGRPLADLLAECDRLFSTTKKPTTSREDEIRDILILPAELNVEKVIKHFRVTLAERYFLVLSNIYYRGLFRKKELKELGNFIACHSKSLRYLGGERYKDLIKYGLDQGHIKESPKSYVVGVRTKEYRLNPSVFSLRTQQHYVPTSKNAKKIRREMTERSRSQFVRHGAVLRKIAASVAELSFDYAAAIKHVAGLHESEGKEHRKRLLPLLLTGTAVWSVDKQGRNYTLPVVMPRDLRPFLWHQGKPLHQIDIKSSQPTLHVLLYSSESEEKSRYKEIVEKRDFWNTSTRSQVVRMTSPTPTNGTSSRSGHSERCSTPTHQRPRPRNHAPSRSPTPSRESSPSCGRR